MNGNDGRLGQVFTNLIDNALSFSPDGAHRHHPGQAAAGTRSRSPSRMRGPASREDRLQTIFERFYSDRPATDAKRGKNSGLGLSISREIVISHKGEIFAENLRDADGTTRGARFVVRLPVMTAMAGGAGGR